MRWCLRVKLAQNWAKFSDLLLRDSIISPIVEESPEGCFWGAKPSMNRTLAGMNVLGRLLMELREAVKMAGHSAFCILSNHQRFQEFLLFSGPIRSIGDRVP